MSGGAPAGKGPVAQATWKDEKSGERGLFEYRKSDLIVSCGHRRVKPVIVGTQPSDLELHRAYPSAQPMYLIGQAPIGRRTDVAEQGLRHHDSLLQRQLVAGADFLTLAVICTPRRSLQCPPGGTTGQVHPPTARSHPARPAQTPQIPGLGRSALPESYRQPTSGRPALHDSLDLAGRTTTAEHLEQSLTVRFGPFRDHFHTAVVEVRRPPAQPELECSSPCPPTKTDALDVAAHPRGQPYNVVRGLRHLPRSSSETSHA